MGFFREQRSRTPAHAARSSSTHRSQRVAEREWLRASVVCTYLAYIRTFYTGRTIPPRAFQSIPMTKFKTSRRSLIAPFGRAVVEEQTPATTRRAGARRVAGTAGNSFSEFSNLDKLIQETLLVSGLV